jgi:hypothetical protein
MKKRITIAALLFASIAVNAQKVSKVIQPEGTLTTQYVDGDGSKLVDGNVNTKWGVRQTALWIQYEAPTAVVVNQYMIASANDVPARDPKGWVLKASQDGNTWVDLDVQKDQTFPDRLTERTFKVDNKLAFKFYRLDILNNAGHPMTQLSEWSLLNAK